MKQLAPTILAIAVLSLVNLRSPASTPSQATPIKPLPFATIQPDAVGNRLESSMIWADPDANAEENVAVAFRKRLTLPAAPVMAVLHIFADARYILWVNGQYVERGPARFQPNGPEYDSIDLSRHLKAGDNVMALLVVGNIARSGKVMKHRPALTAALDLDGKETTHTDSSWKWSNKTRFRKIGSSWANLGDTEIDARVEDGAWMALDYNDLAWPPSVQIGSADWGHLTARRIPMLRETPVPYTFPGGATLPMTLQAGQKLEFLTGRIVQAYPLIEFTADEGSELTLDAFGLHYIAKAGPQSHFTIDTRGISKGAIIVGKGKATITGFKLIERLYPYDRLASFKSDDQFLNRLWEMCARSCEVLSEDAYDDCADRERVEWMDCSPPGYDITRTAMAGPSGTNTQPVYSDPRLLGEMIRRTALTLQPDGWVKAHTCSDRYDIHAKMEDRACDWVGGIRLYYEATGDVARVREIWPAVTAQMDYFLKRRTDRGLVSARDWVVWGNPLGYLTGQTTTLNAFVYRALADSAYLAGVTGNTADAARFSKAAEDLVRAINSVLWDEKGGCYYSGYFSEADLAADVAANRPVKLPLMNGYTTSTLHGNLFALDQGVVPPGRREKVIGAILAEINGPKKNIGRIMTAYYLFKQLYALDQPGYDNQVLDLMRTKWRPMVDSPLECSWEEYSGGSHAHIYGMFPGYFLSAYVLGVRRDAPVADRRLLIEPHPGNLKEAGGVVVTEFGPVPVSWKSEGGRLNFEITIPENVEAMLALPHQQGSGDVQLDGQSAKGTIHGNRKLFPLTPGKHKGSCPPAPQ
jgi:hypothetical protein